MPDSKHAFIFLASQEEPFKEPFAPISAKKIARIEVDKPHPRTLETIAERRGVRPAEIESY